MGQTPISIVAESATRRVCIRSGPHGVARLGVDGIRRSTRRRFAIDAVIEDDVMPTMLLTPGPRSLEAIATGLSVHLGRDVVADEVGLLECTLAPISDPI
jgi:hypothetical protein